MTFATVFLNFMFSEMAWIRPRNWPKHVFTHLHNIIQHNQICWWWTVSFC